ncbi:hypothetical protein [Microseira wollei]|uniref:Lipoprotein n=1 Tax=Microseira wollei NIES-4236 TaxID=2530354 RepID=A0AAV3XQ36_9CYAN|nr:hypothetical protein [Microseira wollei]GET42986.1 hypothetical protein MiSe_78060 [Microseira wollei NIES-4236]
MFHRTKNWLLISILAVSLTACTEGSQTKGDASKPANSSPAATPVKAAATKAEPAFSKTIPGVKNASEVKFKSPSDPSKTGFFDTVNESIGPKHEVAKTATVKIAGWAFLPGKNKIPERVIITLADNKTVVAVADVKLPRPDVAKALNNPAYKSSGWDVTINASALPPGKSVLKAWAYDSATKEATPLGGTHEIVVE